MSTNNFIRLRDALRGLTTDPATASEPIKRAYLCDGQHVSANASVLDNTGDAIHIQPSHDELVIIIEGACGFRVGDETRRVQSGDLIFIPKDTIHGPIADDGRIVLLSIFAPFFDRSKKNIRWSRDGFA